MALTPTEVEGKTFGTALRGYDLDEVDDFLDDVVTTLRDLQDQLAKARANQTESAGPPVIADESAVGRALIAAQTAGDTILSDAREESERILNDARGEAETWATERDARKADADVEMAELTEHVSNVRTQLALLATTVADRLDEMDLTIGGEAESTATGEVAEDADEIDDVLDDDPDVESFNLDDENTSDEGDDVANGADDDGDSTSEDEDE
jgi:cell division initiation protein